MDKDLIFSNNKTSIDLLYDDEDIAIATMDLMHEDETDLDHNLNMCNISHDCILNSIETFKNKPIIFRLSKDRKDVTEHAKNEKELKETQIGGIIPQDTNFNFVKRDNGKTYINCDVILYKKYCPELIDILKKNDGYLEVSTELKAYGNQNKDSGIFYIENFVLQGVVILSKDYPAGIEGSHIQVLKFSQFDTNNMNERYLQFSKNRNVDNDINANTNKIEEKEVKEIVNNLSLEELSELLWCAMSKYKFTSTDGYERTKYYIVRTYFEDNYVIVNNDEDNKLYKITYSIDENKNITIDVDNKVEVVEERNYVEVSNTFIIPKNSYGTDNSLIVENSKEKVIDKEFDEVDNVILCNKILNSKNYKEIVNSAYLVVNDEYENNPIENLKYPVMNVIDNSLVYNLKALDFSLNKANEDNNVEIIEKINSIKNSLCENNLVVENNDTINNSYDEENWQEKYNSLNEEYGKLKMYLDSKEQEYKEKNEKILELQEALNNMQEKLSKYENVEKLTNMRTYLEKFNGNMENEDYIAFTKKLDNKEECYKIEFSDFKKAVDETVLDFICKKKNNTIEKIEQVNIDNTIQKNYSSQEKETTANKVRTIDDVLESLGL